MAESFAMNWLKIHCCF